MGVARRAAAQSNRIGAHLTTPASQLRYATVGACCHGHVTHGLRIPSHSQFCVCIHITGMLASAAVQPHSQLVGCGLLTNTRSHLTRAVL
jgi:hypothetical protein